MAAFNGDFPRNHGKVPLNLAILILPTSLLFCRILFWERGSRGREMAALGKDLSKKSPFLLQDMWSFSTGPHGALIPYGGSFSVWPHFSQGPKAMEAERHLNHSSFNF
jgi:hypothetical protein